MKRRYEFTFSYHIDGIPCKIGVIHYNPGHHGSPLMGPPRSYMDITPPEPEEAEYDVLDRKGYKAPWLERKIDDEIHCDIVNEIREWIDDFKIRAAEERAERRMERL